MRRTVSLGLVLILCVGCQHNASQKKSVPPIPPEPPEVMEAAPPPPPPPVARDHEGSEQAQPSKAKPPEESAAAVPAEPGDSVGGGELGKITGPPSHHHGTVQSAGFGYGSSEVEAAPAQRISTWFKQLQQGAIEYQVPQKMVWKQASTVTVVIHGYAAPQTRQLSQPTGTGALKVSDRMKVQLLCPENPDEFTIEKEAGTEDIKFVPMDSITTWRWQVTPKYPKKAQRLTVQAWVLYPGQEEKYAQELPVYTATLDVDASLIGSAKRGFWNDPGNWIKYMLPGGAGFIFLAGMVSWLVKHFKKSRTQ